VISNIFKQFISPTLSLFTSVSTLICCALPTLLVALGMGASMVSLMSLFPWLIMISKYKVQTFFIAGLFLLVSFYLFWQGRKVPCPADPIQAKICFKLRYTNLIILIISSTIYLIGFFFAFIAVYFFY
tara:strand:- start:170 stop:553 length:384 start_codon:yes stop_codon:yes gene_type:complete